MSIGSLGIVASAAGTVYAQGKASEADRGPQDTNNQQRQVESIEKAEAAAGIGAADSEEKNTQERDADGRRLWEQTSPGEEKPAETPTDPPVEITHAKDPSGQSGSQLDLTV